MQKRQTQQRKSNDPTRRITPLGEVAADDLACIAKVARYEGSSYHKTKPADYNFHPQANAPPQNSLCDRDRIILLKEATQLLRSGIKSGMISRVLKKGLPKYVWAVDSSGVAYEAVRGGGDTYHGYALEDNESVMKAEVLTEWALRHERQT